MRMMRTRKSKVISLVAAILLVIGIAAAFMLTGDNAKYMKYADFAVELEEGSIKKVTISEDRVEFALIGDSEKYYTDNPQYDKFKSELLLKDIEVETEKSSEEIYMEVTEIIVDLLFFVAVGFMIYKFGISQKKNFSIVKNTGVRFSDIAGMEKEKKELMNVVEIMKNPTAFRKTGIRPIKGIILEGPPGNGKTLFAKALAQEAGMNFIATKGADFQSAVMSIGPAKVKSLFKKAMRHKPCIIFIDEFDGIGEARSYDGAGIDKENNRMIISLLNEMDGFKSNDGFLVIAATNSYSSLDKALIRPGRFDRKYTISNPDLDTRIKLIELYTKDCELVDIDVNELAGKLKNMSCAGIATLINEAKVDASFNGFEKRESAKLKVRKANIVNAMHRAG